MNFSVDADCVDKYADEVGGGSLQAQTAQTYLSVFGDISVFEQGWLLGLANAHAPVVAAVTAELARLEEICDAASAGLHQVARSYRQTDQMAVRRADDAYRPPQSRSAYEESMSRNESE